MQTDDKGKFQEKREEIKIFEFICSEIQSRQKTTNMFV